MGTALLVGNGFTSQVIPNYQNLSMMEKLKTADLETYSKANKLFQPFRIDVTTVRQVAYAAGRLGQMRLGSPSIAPPVSDLPYDPKVVEHIENTLSDSCCQGVLSKKFFGG